jgi:hypothetical protein
MNNYACFILTHGRPDNVPTFKALRRYGYTGKILLIVDDLDSSAEQYKSNFGEEHVQIFDKKRFAEQIDTGDNFNELRSPIYARKAAFKIAEELGITHFLVLDDDYDLFSFSENENGQYIGQKKITNLDPVIASFFRFLDVIPAKSVAFAQGGDFIGGEGSSVFKKGLSRKCMNAWFCKTDRPFDFYGTLNDDVNTYVQNGSIGQLFFTISFIRLNQKPTQQNAGGITEAYLRWGTYVKSFYSVLYCPSAVKVGVMGEKQRLHHRINWQCAVPSIISEKHRKI